MTRKNKTKKVETQTFPSNKPLPDINEIRLANLLAVITLLGPREFAERVGVSRTRVYSLAARYKNIGDRFARRLERALGFPRNCMDHAWPGIFYDSEGDHE